MSDIPDHAPLSVSVENQFPQDLFDAMRQFISQAKQEQANAQALVDKRYSDLVASGPASSDR
jgi:hypothetical protein